MSSAAVIIGALRVSPIALRTAKTLWSFGRSEYNRVKIYLIVFCHHEITFMTSCLRPRMMLSFQNGIYFRRKEFAGGSKFFSLRVDLH